jgi:hypothetical protein
MNHLSILLHLLPVIFTISELEGQLDLGPICTGLWSNMGFPMGMEKGIIKN